MESQTQEQLKKQQIRDQCGDAAQLMMDLTQDEVKSLKICKDLKAQVQGEDQELIINSEKSDGDVVEILAQACGQQDLSVLEEDKEVIEAISVLLDDTSKASEETQQFINSFKFVIENTSNRGFITKCIKSVTGLSFRSYFGLSS